MALQFPSSPTNGQIYYDSTSGNRYIYELVTTSWKYAGNNDLLTTSSNTQVLYNTNNGIIGSNGLTFSANTLYTNTINVNQNVTAQYFLGNGVFLTGIVTDFSPAFNVANAAFGHSNITYNAVNSAFAVINANYTSTNSNYVLTNAAFTQSNTDNVRLSAAYVSINAGYTVANAAYAVANAAYDNANNLAISANAYAGAMANSSNAYTNLTYVKLTAVQQTITGDLNVTGNLTFLGNSTVISSGQLSVGDSLIYLASNNYSGTDLVDIGFIANYGNTTLANVHTGLVRDATNKQYYLFQGYDAEPANNTFVPGGNNMTNAVLVADFNTSNLTLGGANAIVWIKTAFDVANAAYVSQNSDYTTTNAAFGVANAAFGFANGVSTNTTAAFGQSNLTYNATNSVFGVANAAYGAANSKVATVSGTSGRVTSSGTTAITLDLATAGPGAGSYSSGISALTLDAYGRVTAVTGTANYAPLASPTFTGTVTVPYLYMARSSAASGISWYSTGYTAWTEYMAAAGQTGQGPTQTVTAPNGTYVTSWARRSFVENNSGFGWTWESGTSTGTTPAIVAELSSATGNFKTIGGIFATTKSFVIDHPSKPGMKLRYGSLEGPENGVYIRGRISGQNFIEYPDYWSSLVDIDTTTVQLTPIGDTAMPRVAGVLEDRILLLSDNKNIDCYYFIQAERKDVEKLIVEF